LRSASYVGCQRTLPAFAAACRAAEAPLLLSAGSNRSVSCKPGAEQQTPLLFLPRAPLPVFASRETAFLKSSQGDWERCKLPLRVPSPNAFYAF